MVVASIEQQDLDAWLAGQSARQIQAREAATDDHQSGGLRAHGVIQ